MKKYIGAVIIIVAIILIIITTLNANKNNTIKIGFIGPITGPLGVSTGESILHAVKLANSERSYVNNKKVEVIYEDDACDPKKSVDAAIKLIEINKVDVIISSLCSGGVLSTAPLAEKNKVVMISPGAAAPSITKAGDYVFRLAGSSITAGKSISEIAGKYDYKKIGIIYENNEYPMGWKDAFIANYKNKDIQITEEGVAVNSTDVRTQILKIKNSKPDVILVATIMPTTANVILNQLKELNVNTPVITNEIFTLQSVIHNKNAEGIMATVYKYDINSNNFKNLLSTYKQTYNKNIQEDIYGALGYDTYNIILDAEAKCNGKKECIKNYLYQVKDYNGLSGNITIDNNGDSTREFTLKKIENGSLVEIK